MEEVDFKEILMFYWKNKVVVFVVTLIFLVLGVLYTNFCVVPNYSTFTTLILTETKFEKEADVQAYAKLVDRYSVIINSQEVLKKVIENLKLDNSIEETRNMMKIESFPNSSCIKIVVTNDNAEETVRIANEIAKVSINKIKEIFGDDKIKVLDEAIVNNVPVNVKHMGNIMLFTLVGLVLSCGYVFCAFLFKK